MTTCITPHIGHLFDQALDLLVVASADGYILHANAATERTLNRTLDELVSIPFLELVHTEDRNDVLAMMARLNAGETVANFRTRWMGQDGQTIFIEWNVRAQDGFYYGCGRDVTAALAEREELRVAKERYEALVRLAPVGIFLADRVGRVQFSNDRLKVIGGRSEEQLAGFGYQDFFHPDEAEHVIAAVAEATSSSSIFTQEHRILRPDGQTRWVRVYAEPILDAQGVAEGFIGMVEDITDRVTAHEELKAAHRRYEMLAHLAPVGIFQTNTDGAVSFVNERMAEVLGISAEEIMRGQWVEALHSEDRTRVMDAWCKAAEKSQDFHDSYRYVHPNGEMRWVETHARALPINAGYIGVIQDITERRNLYDKLARSNRELEEFSYAASHGLREPLRTITGFCDLLEENLRKGMADAAAKDAGVIRRASVRLGNLVRDLLELSRSGKGTLKLENVALEQCLAQVKLDLFKRIDETDAVIESDPLPVVRGDFEQLNMVLQNLISNAIKYQHTGVVPRLRLSARRNGEIWEIHVKDNGIGIPAEYQDSIFKPFHRLHSPQEYEGSGVGLAICRKIVERHGGGIRVESEPGTGSTFIVTLPAAKESARETH